MATRPYVSSKQRAFNTPEGIDLPVEIASFGTRIGAFILDMIFIYLPLWALALALHTGAIKNEAFGENSAVNILWKLLWFVWTNGWFILFEMGTRGATPGKRLLGIRVVARDGGRLEASNVVARNLMRDVEIFVPLGMMFYLIARAFIEGPAGLGMALLSGGWALIFMFFPLFNKDRMRAGDLIAGTWVIRAPRTKMRADLSDQAAHLASHFAFTPEQIAVYGAYEIQTLENVLRGKDAKALGMVADVIREKIGWPYGDDDRAFLEAYYAAVRAKLERGMLFGKRRRDKFDR